METCDGTRVSASGKHKDCLIITLMLCIEKESTTCADYELDGLASENKRLLPTNLTYTGGGLVPARIISLLQGIRQGDAAICSLPWFEWNKVRSPRKRGSR